MTATIMHHQAVFVPLMAHKWLTADDNALCGADKKTLSQDKASHLSHQPRMCHCVTTNTEANKQRKPVWFITLKTKLLPCYCVTDPG